MRKLTRLFCVFLLMFLLVSCAGISETPEQAVANALTAVKDLDKETIQNYFNYGDLIEEDSPDGEMLNDDRVLILMFEKFSFKVLSSEEDEDSAIVKTEITNIDMKLIMAEYLKEAFTHALESIFSVDDDDFDDEMEEIFINLLEREDNKMLTSTIDINLIKAEDSWKIDMNKTLQNAILGGFVSIISDLDDALSFD